MAPFPSTSRLGRIVLLALGLLAAVAVRADAAPAETILLAPGAQRTVQLAAPITRIVISEAGIVDASVQNDKNLALVALKPGRTSMTIFTAIFLFALPAPVRGFQHNVSELKTWFQGMVGTSSEQGFGQRGEQNWSWVNQSIIAVTHRLTRPVNYNQDNAAKPPATMNLIDVSFKTANWIVLAISLAIGLGFIAVMPPRARMTPRSDAEELGILFCLMTVASPLARQYYFMWLFFPITVLIHRAAYDPRVAARAGTWAGLAVAGLLMCLSFPVFPNDLQAYGNNLAAATVIAGELVWHILHPPPDEVTGSPPPVELQTEQQNQS